MFQNVPLPVAQKIHASPNYLQQVQCLIFHCRPPTGFTASDQDSTCGLARAGSCVFFAIVSVTMPRSEFTLAHRIFMYDSYVRTESCREVTWLFRDRYPDIRAPHRDTVRKLINRFRETGSVLDRNPQRTGHVLTEENRDEIGQTLENL